MNRLAPIAALAITFAAASISPAANAAEGMIEKKSAATHAATMERFENALRSRGFTVFARIDHAAAAKSAGLEMPAATVIIFGNPRSGTPAFVQQPSLAIDLPLKALVWQDKQGAVWLGYNSAAYVFSAIYPRHGLSVGAEARDRAEAALASAADEATR